MVDNSLYFAVMSGLESRFQYISAHPKEKVMQSEGFYEYLRALAGGSESLVRYEDFPEIIDVGKDFHDTFRSLNEVSKVTGKEVYGLISYRENRRAIYLPTTFAEGESEVISGEVMSKEWERIRKLGMVGKIGDLHSHPPIEQRIFFSSSDLFSLVRVGRDRHLVSGVVQGDSYMFALASLETASHLVPSIMNRDGFNQYWLVNNLKKNGIGGNGELDSGLLADGVQMNLDIAERHKLGIYEGKLNFPMRRLRS